MFRVDRTKKAKKAGIEPSNSSFSISNQPNASPRTGGASMPTLPNRCQSPDQSLTSPISQPIMISTENGRRCTGSETPTPLDAASASTVDVEVASLSTQSSPSTLTLNFDPKGVVEIPLPDNVVVRCVNGKVVFEKLPTVTTPTAANTTVTPFLPMLPPLLIFVRTFHSFLTQCISSWQPLSSYKVILFSPIPLRPRIEKTQRK